MFSKKMRVQSGGTTKSHNLAGQVRSVKTVLHSSGKGRLVPRPNFRARPGGLVDKAAGRAQKFGASGPANLRMRSAGPVYA